MTVAGEEVEGLALEGNVACEVEEGVHRGLLGGRRQHAGTLRPLRHQPEDRLQVAESVPRRLRARGSIQSAAEQSLRCFSATRGADRGGEEGASPLGTEEASCCPSTCQSRPRASIRRHLRPDLQAQRSRRTAPTALPNAALDSAACTRHGAQLRLVHRLQRGLPSRRRALLPADDHRRVQPLPHRCRRASEYTRRGRSPCDEARLRRVRASGLDTLRQRLALCGRERSLRPVGAVRVVDEAGSVTSASRLASPSRTAVTSECI